MSSFSYEPYTKLIFERQILESLKFNLCRCCNSNLLCDYWILFCKLLSYKQKQNERVITIYNISSFSITPNYNWIISFNIFREINLPRSLNTVVIGHTIFVLAIVFKIILNKLETLKPSLMESAYDLGASKWQAFYYVLLPNIKLSLIIAGLLAFTISLDETLITLFLIGNDTTWPIKLWAKMRVGFSKQVNASVRLILILTSLLVLLIASIISRSEKKIMY